MSSAMSLDDMSLVGVLYKDCMHSILWFLSLAELAVVQVTCKSLREAVACLVPRGDKWIHLMRDRQDPPPASGLFPHVNKMTVFDHCTVSSIVQHIESFPNLVELCLLDICHDKEDITLLASAIASSTSLHSLNFGCSDHNRSRCFLNRPAGVILASSMASLQNLRVLKFYKVQVCDDVMTTLSRTVTRLTCLHLRAAWEAATFASVQAFSSLVSANPDLEELLVKSNTCEDYRHLFVLTNAIASIHRLTYLCLDDCIMDRTYPRWYISQTFASAIAAHANLTHLSLRDHRICPMTGFDDIAGAISGLVHLRHLDMSTAPVHIECSFNRNIYTTFLQTSHHLTSLNLRGLLSCQLNGSDNLVELFAPALSMMVHLEHLDLSHNLIGERGFLAIATRMAPNCHSLTSLDVSHNNIGDLAMVELAKVIQVNPHLTGICLSATQIGDICADALAKAISGLGQLQELGLRSNYISEDSAIAFGRAFSSCPMLQNLDLQDNKLHAVGISALTPFLVDHHSLRNVILKDNGFVEGQSDDMDDMSNGCLRRGTFWHNKILFVV